MGSIEPFNRLVKLAARAFYDDVTTKGENQGKNGRSDNRGIAVVVLDALTRRQWVREEDLAKDLKLHTKQLRRTLRFFEEEKFVIRDHRKETAKGAKINNTLVAATGENLQTGREGDDKIKMHTHSYCCLDYAQIYDVVRYRLHRMKKKLKDELESKNTVQEYTCPNCRMRYSALDALMLISPYDEYFHCESCNGVLVAESQKLASQELGDGDDKSRRHRQENVKEMLTKMEGQLKPLIDQIARVKDLPVPEFGNLQAWEVRAKSASRSKHGDLINANDPSRSSQGLCFGEMKVEVVFSGTDEKGDDIKPENANAPTKVELPWMRNQYMNLTKEQLGETNEEIKLANNLTAVVESLDEKQSIAVNDEERIIQDEYCKGYYAELLKRQHIQEEMLRKKQESTAVLSTPIERQVGMKSKRNDDYAGDDVEWEEPLLTGGRTDRFKVRDLNLEAEAEVSEDDEDEIDWEEG